MKFFVLGAHPELSRAEIEAVLGTDLPLAPSLGKEEEITLVDTQRSTQELQNCLAGVIKVGTIVGELDHWDKAQAADLIRSHIAPHDGKVQFGISTYDKKLAKEMQPLGLEVKKRLKNDGVSCRLVTSRESALSSVVVAKNHLLQNGGEFVVMRAGDRILIGQTEAVQDFEGWGGRDFGRPARDAKSGMLPPKLAHIMLNLTGLQPNQSSVLDPFCGSGTILMEAELLDFKKIYGSDISRQAIQDSKANLAWLTGGNGESELMPADAQAVTLPRPVDAIVTEPFLGRPQKGGETAQQLEAIRRELLELYTKTFSHLLTLLKPKGVMVVSFPVIGEVAVIPNIKGVRPLGSALSYKREGQRIGRLIVRWQKT